MAGGVVNKNDSALVPKPASDFTKNDEDMAIDLTDVDFTSKDPVKRLGFDENGGTNTLDLLTKNN